MVFSLSPPKKTLCFFSIQRMISLRENHRLEIPNQWDRSGLPAWSFFNSELLQEEKDLLFRRHWQLICHQNDLPEVGDFVTWDLVGERALVIRGRDGQLRAFHNLCRHRGSRVIAKNSGNCRSSIICPFHGWAYNIDGTLRGAAQPSSLPTLDPVKYGLKPLEMDLWNGFVFIRFQSGPQPPVSQMLDGFTQEIKNYDLPNLRSTGRGFWTDEIAANWKCVRDVDNEGYHVPMAHPGLQDLFGKNYHDEPLKNGTSRSLGQFREGAAQLWSVRNYTALLKPKNSLNATQKSSWLYIGIFPNLVIGLYPDSVNFYQEYPVDYNKTIQRGSTYKFADEDRQMRLSRYLSMRIDRLTSQEDEQLITWTWEAALSSAYDGVILSDLEYGVKAYHDALRQHFPVLDGPEPPFQLLKAQNNHLIASRLKPD